MNNVYHTKAFVIMNERVAFSVAVLLWIALLPSPCLCQRNKDDIVADKVYSYYSETMTLDQLITLSYNCKCLYGNNLYSVFKQPKYRHYKSNNCTKLSDACSHGRLSCNNILSRCEKLLTTIKISINQQHEDDCTLPKQPKNGRYESNRNKCKWWQFFCVNDTLFAPRHTILTYSCQDNYVLSENPIAVCIDTSWSSSPSCVKVCPPLRSTSVDISCSRKGKTVSCNKLVLPGTQATFACKPSYKLPETTDPGYREITCLDNGTWDYYIFRCIPECGTSIARGKSLIVNGYPAEVGVFPWHVGIYEKNQSDKYEQICGGTLISSKLVISAAHCFYDDVLGKINNISNYAVGAGKYFRDWNATDKHAQKSLVESIRLGERYIGAAGNYVDDIALLKLETPFRLSTVVRPVCMDWDNQYEREQLNVQQSGKVVGWGKNINGESTKNLYEIVMPFVPYDQCLSEVPRNFKEYITLDKFCAGHLNGSSVCDGDSGGGLCFEKNGVWYLRGIISVSPPKENSCDYNFYVGFTSVSNSLHWIRQAYSNASKEL